MQIQIATSKQVDDLHALIERAYRGKIARRGWTHEADLLGGQRIDRNSLMRQLEDPCQSILIAYNDDKIEGCIAVADKGGAMAYIGLVTVEPELQGRGLGGELLQAAEAHARQYGARNAEMTVIAHRRELIDWYERRGYVRTGEARPFPASDARFGLPKRDDLSFVVLAKTI